MGVKAAKHSYIFARCTEMSIVILLDTGHAGAM